MSDQRDHRDGSSSSSPPQNAPRERRAAAVGVSVAAVMVLLGAGTLLAIQSCSATPQPDPQAQPPVQPTSKPTSTPTTTSTPMQPPMQPPVTLRATSARRVDSSTPTTRLLDCHSGDRPSPGSSASDEIA